MDGGEVDAKLARRRERQLQARARTACRTDPGCGFDLHLTITRLSASAIRFLATTTRTPEKPLNTIASLFRLPRISPASRPPPS
jgi:hypothetical protein